MSLTACELPSETSRGWRGLKTRVTGETFLAALRWAVGASVYFWVVYYGCNWLASLRPSVPSLFFEWERRIPFVPAMIVPYLSEDVFFFLSFFLCLTLGELRRHAVRLLLAINVAAVFFLLFPLRIGFGHPPVAGLDGMLFTFLGGLDRPFNLAPSLHLAILVVLWAVYSRHTRGVLRLEVQGWFVLIGLSTVLVRQHHLVDLVTGTALGMLCIYLVPEDPKHGIESERSLGVGSLYATGAALCLLGAWAFQPIGLVLIWPAVSLGIVAAAYFDLGPSIFRKADGQIPRHVRLLLGPYLLGAWVAARVHRRRKEDAPCQLSPNVWIGGWPNRAEARRLMAGGVTAVLDLTAEFSEQVVLRYGTAYLNVPVLDLTPPTGEQLAEAVRFIEEHADRGTVYIHCALGCWRSACVAAAYLLASGRARTVAEAVALTQAARPGARARVGRVDVLREFERRAAAASRASYGITVTPSAAVPRITPLPAPLL